MKADGNELKSTNRPRPARVTWVAGTRGEFLVLGQAYLALRRETPNDTNHWMLHTGEQGTAADQALDFLGLSPDETAELCHPANESTLRLGMMIERIEAFVRHHKASHIVFSGYGATAAAAALHCHGRDCHGLWLRPPDPADLIPRLRWEAGLERIIRACAPGVEVWPVPTLPDLATAGPVATHCDLGEEIPGLRPDAPRVVVAVGRREWGIDCDVTPRVVNAARRWAETWPAVDWVVLSNLNARMEGPLHSIAPRPPNLLSTPPLPYPVWRELLESARLALTDSPLIAAETLEAGVRVATLGGAPEAEATTDAIETPALIPEDLLDPAWLGWMSGVVGAFVPERRGQTDTSRSVMANRIRQPIEDWLARTSIDK